MLERIYMSPNAAVYRGDSSELPFPENYFDAVVTDPPAGIGFMGREWDSAKGGRESWVSWLSSVMTGVLRCTKPGGHALVWALPRTSHWTATALELAGWEIRDCITHIFGTGFPKSMDVSKAIDKAAKGHPQGSTKGDPDSPNSGKYRTQATEGKRSSRDKGQHFGAGPGQFMREKGEKYERNLVAEAKTWEGWGTALKPATEHWWLVRKPLSEKTVADNVLKWGTGALNIDACRIGTEIVKTQGGDKFTDRVYQGGYATCPESEHVGRFPANLIFTHSPLCTEEECAPGCPVAMLDAQSGASRFFPTLAADGYDAFLYQPKPSTAERNRGVDGKNNHPTVKSIALMRWLLRLVTPPAGTILDPFGGSGSTGVAAIEEGFRCVLVERDQDESGNLLGYGEIICSRLREAEERCATTEEIVIASAKTR